LTVKDPERGNLMRVRCVALFAVLVFANPAAALAQSSSYPGIHVNILNIPVMRRYSDITGT
jgi:hypothetical protein